MKENDRGLLRVWCERHGIVAVGIWQTIKTMLDKHRNCGGDYGVIVPDLWEKKEERRMAHKKWGEKRCKND